MLAALYVQLKLPFRVIVSSVITPRYLYFVTKLICLPEKVISSLFPDDLRRFDVLNLDSSFLTVAYEFVGKTVILYIFHVFVYLILDYSGIFVCTKYHCLISVHYDFTALNVVWKVIIKHYEQERSKRVYLGERPTR